MGVDENDPWGRLGYLQSYMFRAARLVVDTGLHHFKWSRERAKATLGDTFDLRAFHDTALSAGAMPIEVLAGVIERWTEAQRA